VGPRVSSVVPVTQHAGRPSPDSATTAISPTAPATISPAVVGCSMPLTLVPASVPTNSPKKIPRLPQPPSPSVPIAAAPYGGSQPCHAPATLRHSPVTHHDRAADVDRDRARPPHIGQQCPQRHRTADQSSSSRNPLLRALQIDTIATHSFRAMATRGNKLPSTRCRRPSIARDCYRSLATIPIVPNLPQLRSIRLL